MALTRKTVRVFTSSTLRGLQTERDGLAKRAFFNPKSLFEKHPAWWGEAPDEPSESGKTQCLCGSSGASPHRKLTFQTGSKTLLALFGVATAMVLLPGCSHLKESHPVGVSPNKQLLDEMDASGSWFFAKKTRPIWAKRLTQDLVVTTLEGKVAAKAGDFICRGEAGDIWPQKAQTLEARYVPTENMDASGWRKFQPRPDAEGVMAARVDHPFWVLATWGRLSGKAGDYVLKNRRDWHVPYPTDVWIVDQNLFRATYEAVK